MFCEPSSLRLNVPLTGTLGVMPDINDPESIRKTVISFA